MSDIRFEGWLHRSGTGGVYQDSAGNVGIASTQPQTRLDIGNGGFQVGPTGIATVTTINTTNIINATPLTNRNLMINGAMNVAQRGTSSTSTTGGYHTVDRFRYAIGGYDEAATHAQVDVASGTDPYKLGFRKAFKVTNGNQTSGVGSNDYIQLDYYVEAQDLANSGWDITNPNSFLTFSFWMKSSVSQFFTFAIRCKDGTEHVINFKTPVLSADTWTKVTKTIPGNSNLTVNNDNGQGFQIMFFPFLGTAYTTVGLAEDTWSSWASSKHGVPNTSTWWTTNDATWEITGLQLELGSVATPFEHRSYGDELSRCARYYQKIAEGNQKAIAIAYGYNGTYLDWVLHNPMGPMRTNPSLDQVNGTGYYNYYNSSQGGLLLNSNFIIEHGQICQSNVYFDPEGSVNAGQSGYLKTNNAACYLAVQAEL